MERVITEANRLLRAPARDRNSSIEFELRLEELPVSVWADALTMLRDGDAPVPPRADSLSVVWTDARGRAMVARREYAPGGTATAIAVMRKTRIAIANSFITDGAGARCGFRAAVSIEELVPDAGQPAPSAIARLRARHSREVTIRAVVWRVDLTLVLSIPFSELAAHPEIRPQFFERGIEYSDARMHVEVEVEYIRAADDHGGVRGRSPLADPAAAALTPNDHGGVRGQSPLLDDVLAAAQYLCAIAHPRGAASAQDSARALMISHVIARVPALARGARGGATLKGILNNAIGLTRAVYMSDVYPATGYWLTDKTDGERALALVTMDGAVVIVTDGAGELPRGDEHARATIGTSADSIAMIIDGEWVGARATFYAFDCLLAGGEPIIDQPFAARYALIDAIEDTTRADAVTPAANTGVVGAQPLLRVIVKEFAQIDGTNLREAVTRVYGHGGAAREYPIDGLIFTQDGVGYAQTRNYKWKPIEAMTIDFLLFECPHNFVGSRGFVAPALGTVRAPSRGHADALDPNVARGEGWRVFVLFCACSEEQRRRACIAPLPFHGDIVPADLRGDVIHFVCPFAAGVHSIALSDADVEARGGAAALNGHVFEMRWSAATGMWEIVRPRADKRVGNNLSIAIDVFSNYIDPFPLEALYDPGATGEVYFEREADDSYVASNKLRRYIITALLRRYGEGAQSVLDLGGGRAQDFTRYVALGVGVVMSYDRDSMAVATGVARVENDRRGGPRSGGGSARGSWRGSDRGGRGRGRGRGAPGPREPWVPAAERWMATMGPPLRVRASPCTAYIARVADLTALDVNSFLRDLADVALARHSFSLVTCTFAFHYFCASIESARHVFALIDVALARDGAVMITTMSGARVRALLDAPDCGGVWERAPYRIRRAVGDGASDGAGGWGEMIEVSVPFSDDMRGEPLCDFDALGGVAAEFDMVEVARHSFGDAAWIPAFALCERALAARLSAADIEYTSLFETVVYRRRAGGAHTAAKKESRGAARNRTYR